MTKPNTSKVQSWEPEDKKPGARLCQGMRTILALPTELGPSHRMVLATLATIDGRHGCYPAIATIAESTGLGARQVKRIIDSLIKEHRLLSRTRKGRYRWHYDLRLLDASGDASVTPAEVADDMSSDAQVTPAPDAEFRGVTSATSRGDAPKPEVGETAKESAQSPQLIPHSRELKLSPASSLRSSEEERTRGARPVTSEVELLHSFDLAAWEARRADEESRGERLGAAVVRHLRPIGAA